MARPGIFVVGCPRSGTTLVQSLLGQHPGIRAFPETNILWYAAGDIDARRFGWERLGAWDAMWARGYRWLNRRGWQYGKTQRMWKRFRRFVRLAGREDLASQVPLLALMRLEGVFSTFASLMDEIAQGNTWAEKSPQNLFVLDFIDRYMDKPFVIHVIRDPRDNLGSLRDAEMKYREFRDHRVTGPDGARNALAYWNRALHCSLAWRGNPRHYFLRYEDLAGAPEPTLKDLCGFLGIEFSAAMLEYSGRDVVKSHEAWKRGWSGIKIAQSKWEQVFSADERQLIESGLEDVDAHFPRRF